MLLTPPEHDGHGAFLRFCEHIFAPRTALLRQLCVKRPLYVPMAFVPYANCAEPTPAEREGALLDVSYCVSYLVEEIVGEDPEGVQTAVQTATRDLEATQPAVEESEQDMAARRATLTFLDYVEKTCVAAKAGAGEAGQEEVNSSS